MGRDLAKSDPAVVEVARWVDGQVASSRVTDIEWEKAAPVVRQFVRSRPG